MTAIPRDALRDLTRNEKFILASIHRLPCQPWGEILADVGMNASLAAKARDMLEALGVLEHYPQEFTNRRGHRRFRTVYRTSQTGHPWLSVYDAWLNAGRPADSCPLPERYAPNFTPKADDSPATPRQRIPQGKIHSERQRVLETFLRNLGAPWSQIRIMTGVHLARVTHIRDELRLDGVLLSCIDRYTDTLGRTILRTIYLPDEGNAEVIITRKQYGLTRPYTPQARRDALDPPHYGKDVTVPLSMFPSLVGDDEDVGPIGPSAPMQSSHEDIKKLVGPEHEMPAPVKAQVYPTIAPGMGLIARLGAGESLEDIQRDIKPAKPRTGGFLANLGPPPGYDTPSDIPIEMLPREEDDWKVAALREQEADEARKRALQAVDATDRVAPDEIGVTDTHDIDPGIETVDQAPEQETLGFASWTFPDSE